MYCVECLIGPKVSNHPLTVRVVFVTFTHFVLIIKIEKLDSEVLKKESVSENRAATIFYSLEFTALTSECTQRTDLELGSCD